MGPKYVLDEMGTVQYHGHFTDINDKFVTAYYRYLQVIKVARRSRIVDRTANLISGTSANNPVENAHLMVKIIAKSAAIVEQDLHADFVVLFWDNDSEDSALILECLAEDNIRTIKVSDLMTASQMDTYRIPDDNHPTAAANILIAQGLIKRLGNLNKKQRLPSRIFGNERISPGQ